MRYIDADRLLTDELTHTLPVGFGKASGKVFVFADDIENAPEEDVIKVVKCTHCKYCKQDDYYRHELYCSKMSDDDHTHWVPVGFYCGYGEELEDD